jgi:hypothetical protein
MSTQYPASLKAVGGARTGIAPVNLLDILDVNGNLYYFSDRPSDAPVVLNGGRLPILATPPVPIPPGEGLAWSFSGTQTASAGSAGSASATSETGTIDMEFQGPFTSPNDMTFSGFNLPPLPLGAVITAAYAVCVAGPVPSDSFNNMAGFPLLADGGQCSMPISPSSIAGASYTFRLWNTLAPIPGSPAWIGFIFFGLDHQVFTVFDIAIAVYYSFPPASGFLVGSGPGGGGSAGIAPYGKGPYIPWLIEVPQITFHRSLATDVGSFKIQNLSGDTLSRDMEKLLRRSTFEGAEFVYRLWQPDAEAAWLEVHGTLTVPGNGVSVDIVELKGSQLINPAQEDTPLENYCETCQIQWGGKRCGATGSTECQYSYQTCQVVERIMVVLNNFEKNYGEANTDSVVKVVNRRRRI